MKIEIAVVLSIILGGLLGFVLSYAVLNGQISTLKAELNDVENDLTDINDSLQSLDSSVQTNQRSIENLQDTIGTIQDSLSGYQEQMKSQVSMLQSSINNNVASLQLQIDYLKKEWKYIGTWNGTEGFYTVPFEIKGDLRIGWFLDGKSWQSYFYVKIYFANGTFYDAVGDSGWLSSGYVVVSIEEPGMYYLDIDVYDANSFFISVYVLE